MPASVRERRRRTRARPAVRALVVSALAFGAALVACKERDERATRETQLRDDAVAPSPAPLERSDRVSGSERGSLDGSVDPASFMDRHFAHATTAKDAVILGDLDAAREALRWLAEHGASAEVPDAWQPTTAIVRAIAARGVEHRSLAAVAQRVGELGQQCGACHAALNADVAIEVVERAPEGDDHAVHMRQHKWAVDRLWAGLVTPSDERWAEGARALADAPLHLQSISSYGDDAPEIIELAGLVHQIGGDARVAERAGKRASLLGRLLSTCARCHALSRDR